MNLLVIYGSLYLYLQLAATPLVSLVNQISLYIQTSLGPRERNIHRIIRFNCVRHVSVSLVFYNSIGIFDKYSKKWSLSHYTDKINY